MKCKTLRALNYVLYTVNRRDFWYNFQGGKFKKSEEVKTPATLLSDLGNISQAVACVSLSVLV